MVVMIVDDDELVLRSLVRTLEHELDVEVVGISDGYEAIERYEERAPEIFVVIIDLGETKSSLANMFRKFLSRFWKVYIVRKAYK